MQSITFLCPKPFCHTRLFPWSDEFAVSQICLKHGRVFEVHRAVRIWETCDACGNTEMTLETLGGGKWRVDPASSDNLRRGRQPDKRVLRPEEFYICQRCEAKRAVAIVRAA